MICGIGGIEMLWLATICLLNGTRSGFQDGHVQLGAPSDAVNRAKILPINIDVNALIEALEDDSAGELGSYFGPGSLTEREGVHEELSIHGHCRVDLFGFGDGGIWRGLGRTRHLALCIDGLCVLAAQEVLFRVQPSPSRTLIRMNRIF